MRSVITSPRKPKFPLRWPRQQSSTGRLRKEPSEKPRHRVIASAAKQSLPEKEIASSLVAPRNDSTLPLFSPVGCTLCTISNPRGNCVVCTAHSTDLTCFHYQGNLRIDCAPDERGKGDPSVVSSARCTAQSARRGHGKMVSLHHSPTAICSCSHLTHY